jgi:alpha-D-ribose 1-methylphosphonate 5-triphosphate diphosphatase
MVLPGIVDIHGDGFERHLAPRRGALESLSAGLGASTRSLAANGITTAVIAQFFSWEGGMRGPDVSPRRSGGGAGRDADAGRDDGAAAARGRDDRRFRPGARRSWTEGGIRYVVLNDHLPHKELAAGKRPPSLTGQALKARRSPEAHHAMLQAMHDRWEEVPKALCAALRGVAAAWRADRQP